MKKFLCLSLLALTAQSFAAVDTEKVEAAIEEASLSRLKSLLNKIDREELTQPARKKMYRGFYDTATDATEQREQSISIVGNWRDAAKTGGGLLKVLVGAGLAVLSINEDISPGGRNPGYSFNTPVLAVGLAGIISGLVFMYKGITCSTQKGQLAQAKAIEKYLKGRLKQIEEEQPASGN